MYNIKVPTNVLAEENAINSLSGYIKQFGTNVLLITAKELEPQLKLVKNVLLSEISLEILYLDFPEPSCDLIDRVAGIIRDDNKTYDCLVGLGGGSVIDYAKALSIALTQPESIWSYANLSYKPPIPLVNPTIPVIAIPTTSGTGAEVTPYAVLTNNELKQKGTIQEEAIFPKLAILDPSLLKGMPKKLTASTGLDAFAHALESYINISKPAPFTELMAIEAMKLIFKYLPVAYEQPNNTDARLHMAWASTLAGLSIAHRGTTAAHAIAEPLGALAKIPHGLAVSMCTLPVLKASFPEVKNKLESLTSAIFTSEVVSGCKAEFFLQQYERLMKKLNILDDISECLSKTHAKLQEELLDNVINYKFRPLKQHPIEFTKPKIKEVIANIFVTKKVYTHEE